MKKLFSVYDAKTEAYGPVLTHTSDGDAIRSYEMACNNKDSLLGVYPNDFTLMRIGTFDENSGVIELEVRPVPVYTHSKPVEGNVDNEISNETPIQSGT